VLEAHAAITQAVAIGLPDERLGERVAAFVVLAAGASFDLDECRRWFEAQGAPRFATPERIVIVDEVPRLSSGKPDAATLRALLD
jgi:acyl-CoA synthetase (AMP-forming)/AMP-acid ligase II